MLPLKRKNNQKPAAKAAGVNKINVMNQYTYIVFSGATYTVSQFKKNYPDCKFGDVTHLKSEMVDGDRNRLLGAVNTSMGTLTLFNHSELN